MILIEPIRQCLMIITTYLSLFVCLLSTHIVIIITTNVILTFRRVTYHRSDTLIEGLDIDPSSCLDSLNEISTPRVLGTIKIVLIVFIMHVLVYAWQSLILRRWVGTVWCGLAMRHTTRALDNECRYIAYWCRLLELELFVKPNPHSGCYHSWFCVFKL